jgi:hypothetical protein
VERKIAEENIVINRGKFMDSRRILAQKKNGIATIPALIDVSLKF